nr:hypothetical protein [Tanacetum cinerariifolium]
MRTRSSGPVVEPSTTQRKRRIRKRPQQQVDPIIEDKFVITMADTRTMEELLQAPTEGYGYTIVIPAILADNFELKHGLLNLVTSKQFCGLDREDPHAHIHWFNKITSTIKYKDVPNTPVVAKVNTNTSTFGLSPDVAAHIDAVKALLYKNTTPLPVFIKAVEESYVTCGGPHPYYQCLATDGNASQGYQDNIQSYVSAATINYNQGNTRYRPPCVANQVRPPSFPPLQNNQNRGSYYQNNLSYRAPTQPTQVAPSNEFADYMKINETNIRAMQNQINNMKTELRNEFQTMMLQQNNRLENMLSNYFQANKPSGSGTLPSNTITNPKGDLKAITTHSGVSYDGPPIPPLFSPPSKVVEKEPEVTKDTVQLNTEEVQPPDVQTQTPISEPVIAPKPKTSIPYSSRLNTKSFEKENLLSNKEKLFELANAPVNENCSVVILKKFPKKLGDLDKFLIPCNFPEIVECIALADLGASINLMPLSIWKKLSLPELTPTQMILELADRSTTRPTGIAEDVFVRVGKFYFPADFVVVDYVVDPRVPLILGRPFLRTTRALIDVYGEELTLCGGDFILKEIESYLASDSVPSRIDDAEFDLGGEICLIEEILINDPASPLPLKDLKCEELKSIESSVNEPLDLELKDLPSDLKQKEEVPMV